MPRFPTPFAVLLALLALATPAAARGDAVAGTWEGRIDPAMLDLRIVVDLEPAADGWTGRLDVPLQGAHDLVLDEVVVDGDGAVAFSVPALPRAPRFEGRLVGGSIRGTFAQGDVAVPFELVRPPRLEPVAAPDGWPGTWRGAVAPGLADFEMVLRLEDDGGALAGTLAIPAQGLEDLPLRFVAATGEGVTAEIPALPADARLGLRWEDGSLAGTYQQEGATFPISFEREAAGTGPR